MSALARVGQVDYLGGYCLRLTFSDGLVRELDFEASVAAPGFELLSDAEFFALVQLDPLAGTICWPNGVDFDPDVLHGDHQPASGSGPVVVREYHLHATG